MIYAPHPLTPPPLFPQVPFAVALHLETLHEAQYGQYHAIFVFLQSISLIACGIPHENIFIYIEVSTIPLS
jgi:hypothetical protein